MKKISKLLLTLLSIATIITCFITVAFSAETLTNGNYEYVLFNNNGTTEARITKYKGSESEAFIPNSFDGKYITEIGENAFSGTSIEYVFFPNKLRTIAKKAFYNCAKLKTFEIPDSVTYIGYSNNYNFGAFQNCTSLKSVVIGSGVKTIPHDTFCGCSSLETVIFSEGLEKIGVNSFQNCVKLKELKFPDTLKEVQSEAFCNDTSIKTIDFGKGINSIGLKAFHSCSSLLSVNLPDSLTEVAYANYGDAGVFQNCTSLKSVVIGSGVKTIPHDMFYGCTSLTTVYIPASVETIANNAFGNCTNIKNVYFLGNCPVINDNSGLNPSTATKWYKTSSATGFNKVNVFTPITLKYDAAGGEILIGDDAVEEYTKTSVPGITPAPLIPAREGYTFGGWFTNSECSGTPVDFAAAEFKSNTTFYAKWTANTYTVFFDPIGGSVKTGGVRVEYNQNIGTLPTPTLAGQTFKGWYRAANGSGQKVTSTTKMPAKDIILYAYWGHDDNSTTVFFHPNGGSFCVPESHSFNNYSADVPASPTRPGYIFTGWAANSASSEKFDFENTLIQSNTTVYALWQKNALAAPTGIKATSITENTVDITWNEVTDAVCYYVYINGEFYDVTQTAGISIIDLSPNTAYNIVISAVCTAGESDNTATLKVTTKAHTHHFSVWTVSTSATCTKAGEEVRFCSDCRTKETRTINALGHNYTVLKSDGTYHWHKCERCDAISGKEAHNYKAITTKATLKSNGKIETKCAGCGKISKTTTIYSPKTFTLSASAFTYNGKAVKPTVTVKDSKGNVITSSNYTVTYSNNNNIGTGKVTITFKGNYSGTKTLSFSISLKQVTGLKAPAVKTTSVKLTWTAVTGAKYYKVERSTDGKKWTVLTTTDKTTYTASKLTAGKKYQFRVTALDITKKSAGKTSTVLKTGTLTNAPAVTLKSSKSKTATASWKKVTGASKYVVYKSTNGKKWTKVTTTSNTSYTLTKLTGGKKIYVKVTAVNAYSKESAASSVKNAKVKK